MFEIQLRQDSTAYIVANKKVAQRLCAVTRCRDVYFSGEDLVMYALTIPMQNNCTVRQIIQLTAPCFRFTFKNRKDAVLKLRFSAEEKRNDAYQKLTAQNYGLPEPLPLLGIEGLFYGAQSDDVARLCSAEFQWEIEQVVIVTEEQGTVVAQVTARTGPPVRSLHINSDGPRSVTVYTLDEAAAEKMLTPVAEQAPAPMQEARVLVQLPPTQVVEEFHEAAEYGPNSPRGRARSWDDFTGDTHTGETPAGPRGRRLH